MFGMASLFVKNPIFYIIYVIIRAGIRYLARAIEFNEKAYKRLGQVCWEKSTMLICIFYSVVTVGLMLRNLNDKVFSTACMCSRSLMEGTHHLFLLFLICGTMAVN